MTRANFLGAPAAFNLNLACRALSEAFGHAVYLVGSALERRDYRDVDVRCLLDDDEFDRLFPGCPSATQYHPAWSLLCCAISEWLAARTGLPIDFQFQKRTKANAEFPDGARQPYGVALHRAWPPRIVQRPNGCYAACIASLTGIPLDEIPHPIETDHFTSYRFTPEEWTAYRNEVNRFLRARGWWRAWIPADTPPRGYAIAHGDGPRGVGHCVVVKDGQVVMDPHPDGGGLVGVEGYETLVKCAALPVNLSP